MHRGLSGVRRVVFLVPALLVVGAAQATDTVTCADAEGEVSLSYVLDAEANPPILRVDMQLTGDFGVSTAPGQPDHDGEYVSSAFAADGMEGADVSWRDGQGNEHRTISFRIGRVFEAQQAALGGVIAIGGGGLWTVTCRSSALGM